jgi:two-component system, NtrC family, sensor kinase
MEYRMRRACQRPRQEALSFRSETLAAMKLSVPQLNESETADRSEIPSIPEGSLAETVSTQLEDMPLRTRADAAEAFLVSLVESSPDAIVGTTLDGIVVSWNRGATELVGYEAAEMIGRPVSVFTHPDRIREARQLIEAISRGEQFDRYETELVRKDGTLVSVSLTLSPVRNAAGKVTGIAGIGHDITNRKRAQEELLFKTTLLESIAETAIDGILVVDRNGRWVQRNRRFAEIFNFSAELLDDCDDKKIMAWVASQASDPEAFAERIQYFQTHESETARDEIQLRDGRIIDRYSAPLKDARGRYCGRVAYFRDITDLKRAEQALRESEQRYRELFENASEISFTTDLDGRFTSMNRAGQRVLGFTQEEAARMDIFRLVAAESLEVLEQDRIKMMAGATQLESEIVVVAKDGRRVRLEVKPRLIRRDDRPAGVQVIARDITGRNIAEMELRQAQKLESVGRLASGIAHEINTPIQFIGDNAHFLEASFASLTMLLGKFGELRDAAAAGTVSPELLSEVKHAEEESDCAFLLEEVPSAITQTVAGVERVGTIVRAMKEFAHPESKEMTAADLNQALLSTITVARNEWKYVAAVETDFADLPLVVCNVGDLNQVFLNLLVNAAHAIADVVKGDGKGHILIRTAAEDERVHISIADTGSGIPENIRTRIFDPFFTTKEVGRGTGQGLAIARSVVVERHNGTLTFESEVGKGTTFHIRLPIAPEDPTRESRND